VTSVSGTRLADYSVEGRVKNSTEEVGWEYWRSIEPPCSLRTDRTGRGPGVVKEALWLTSVANFCVDRPSGSDRLNSVESFDP
jgi:hypothetical protein